MDPIADSNKFSTLSQPAPKKGYNVAMFKNYTVSETEQALLPSNNEYASRQ